MNAHPAFYIGTHPDSCRCGEPAEILKIEYIKPAGLAWRLCFKVKYPDGRVDWSPVADKANYVITDNPAREG